MEVLLFRLFRNCFESRVVMFLKLVTALSLASAPFYLNTSKFYRK
jgi:hypothetical protein